ncbi:MAG: GAF domain-containing protein [Anaerolineae bacterium]|nr:GAF domain-containing protein [Anaerolineae bacterium]
MTRQLRQRIAELEAQLACQTAALRDLEALRRRVQELELAHEVAAMVAAILDLDVALRRVVDLIKERFNFYFVSLALREGERVVYRSGSAIGETGERLDAQNVAIDLAKGPSLIAEAIRGGEPVLVNDVLADPRYLSLAGLPLTRSELTVPIRVRGRVVGALDVQSDHPDAFALEDIAVLQFLANQSGVALENARLFSDRERRITELAIVNEIGQTLAVATHLDALLLRVHQQVGRLFEASNFYVATYDRVRQQWTTSYDVEHGKRLSPATHPLGAGLTSYIIENRRTLLFGSEEEMNDFRISLGLEPLGEQAKSWLGVPLITGDLVVGVMAIQSYTEENLYGEQDRMLFTTIAAQVANAIRNAELFEALEQRVEQERLTRVITDRVVQAPDTEAVLRIVSEELGRVLRASTVVARLGAQEQLLAAASGASFAYPVEE